MQRRPLRLPLLQRPPPAAAAVAVPRDRKQSADKERDGDQTNAGAGAKRVHLDAASDKVAAAEVRQQQTSVATSVFALLRRVDLLRQRLRFFGSVIGDGALILCVVIPSA